MNAKLKYWLIAVLVLLGQSFAASTAAAHEADPAHTADECAVCISVQINDAAPTASNAGFEAPPMTYWAVGDVQTVEAVLKALSGGTKARAPPQ